MGFFVEGGGEDCACVDLVVEEGLEGWGWHFLV